MKKIFPIIRNFIKETDKLLLGLCFLASVYGVLMVYSATRFKLEEGQFIARDAVVMGLAVIVGIVIALIISAIDYEVVVKLWPIVAGVSVLLMLLLFVIGVGPNERSDAKTWIPLGPIYFQPSELLKIAFIITFSIHLDLRKDKINKIKSIALLGVHALIPIGLVAVSGDMGSAVVFVIMTAVMLFSAGLHWGYFAGGAVLVAAASPLVWLYGFSTIQRERFLALIYPDLYPDIIYQQERGMNALGSGGFFGQGLFKGIYTQGGLVPERENDMIFTVIGEELGFAGCIAALVLLVLISIEILRIGRKSRDDATRYMCAGMAAVIIGQVVINIGMVLKLLPVIGITLPFFSAGGSSNLCIYIGIGLILSIYRYNQTRDAYNFTLTRVSTPFSE
ncbi:MAG: FtsW/RodA/SpoVE family cell cycle protein [Clostridiales bacterium]|nr:FtsW/RodA/SpoVE family cell cycle protein [Clostridiales bacterium]